jgi:hypothetical protein
VRSEPSVWRHPRKRHVIIDVTHHAGVVHLSMTPALGEFPPQIGKPNIGAKSLDQILFLILTSSSAFRAG